MSASVSVAVPVGASNAELASIQIAMPAIEIQQPQSPHYSPLEAGSPTASPTSSSSAPLSPGPASDGPVPTSSPSSSSNTGTPTSASPAATPTGEKGASPADQPPPKEEFTAAGVTGGAECRLNSDPGAAAEAEAPKDTVHNIKVNYQFPRKHQMCLGIWWLLTFVGMCISKWITFTGFAATSDMSIDVAGNAHGGPNDASNEAATALMDPIRPVSSGLIFMIVMATLVTLIPTPFLTYRIQKTQAMTEKLGYLVMGTMLTVTWALVVLVGAIYFMQVQNHCVAIGGPANTTPLCELAGGYSLFMASACFAFMASFWIILRNKYIPHALCMGFSITMWVVLIFSLIALGNGATGNSMIPFYILYACYMIECFKSSAFQYLRNILSVESASMFVNRLRGQPPDIWMHVSCYHYEQRTRYVTYTDSQGRTQTRTETYTVRVETYAETIKFIFRSWVDLSGAIIGLEKYGATKLNLFKNYSFRNLETQEAFNRQAREFRERNRHRDVHMDYSDGMDIAGFKPKVLAFTDLEKKPKVMNPCIFILISLIGGSYPFRMYLDHIAVKKGFWFLKEVSM